MKNALLVSHWQNPSEFPISDFSEFSTLVAVDGGANLFYSLDKIPNILIGDFDSINSEVHEKFAEIEQITFAQEKDQTDGELAILWCKKNGYNDIILANDFGGRVDQSLGLISLLLYAKELNLSLKILTGKEILFLIPNELRLKVKEGRLSLIPLTEKIENISVSGVKYLLNNDTLLQTQTRGISNEIISEEIEISYEKGLLLAIIEKEVLL